MIAYGPGGPADYEHMDDWRIGCDRCGTRTPWTDTDTWFVGESTDCRVYCPRCARRIAKRLIGSALPRRRKPLGLAVTALIAIGVLALRRPTKGA
jgi:hypothetical protein